MKVNLDPAIVKDLKKDDEDVEALVNEVLRDYAKGEFFPKSDVALMAKIERPFRVKREEIADMFDEATQEFRGVAVVGETQSQTLWVPSMYLHDALEENDTVLVLKTPRKKGIRTVEGNQIYAWIPEEDDVN